MNIQSLQAGAALVVLAAFLTVQSRAAAQSTRPDGHQPAASQPATGTATPPLIDVAHAPAPLYDDPIWHGASDPTIAWMPGKGDDGAGEYWMYYTQRRATLPNKNGVDWVHGTAIGIAKSPDGLHWKYVGVAQGEAPMDGVLKELGDPIRSNVSWWAPTVFWAGGNGIAGGGAPGDTLHMFVTLVHGIFDHWAGDRTIEHFTSDDGIHWRHVSRVPLASNAVIDPTVYKIGGDWYLWYKNEAAGSRTFVAKSKDLTTWQDLGDTKSGSGHEAPFVWKWKGAYWLIHDSGHGLDTWRSPNGLSDWTQNATLLDDNSGRRLLDQGPGHHPWLIVQPTDAGEQLLIYYFVHDGDKTYIQLAEVKLAPDGTLTCDRQ